MATSQNASSSRQCLALTCGIAVTQTSDDSIPWLGTTRLRLGGAIGKFLVYGTGGVGYGAFKSNQTVTTALASVTSESNEQRLAWVAGGGIEAAPDAHWSVQAEYLHVDAGSNTTTYTLAGVGLITQQSRMVEDIARFGVNYRF
jgi:outer membrane immunogenic protein